MPERNRRKLPDKREIIRRAISECGSNIDSWEPVTREEAWEQVIDPFGMEGLCSRGRAYVSRRDKYL